MQVSAKTTLDSFQGKWVSEKDSSYSLEVIGRDVFKKELSEDLLPETVHLKLYFTDFPFRLDDVYKVAVDTSLKNGKYLVFKDQNDNSEDCYEFMGFYKDSTTETISFHTYGYFKMSSILTYRKVY
jgi:hypothetical protein